MTTPFQKEANARNAQLSTGPKTEEGKARARRNALERGLAGAGVVLPENQETAIAALIVTLNARYQPADEETRWLVKQVATATVRIEACQAEQSVDASQRMLEATLFWDRDRKLEAETIAKDLVRDPAGASLRLQRFAQGCNLLQGRWSALLVAGTARGYWSDEEVETMYDLLGVAPELRATATVFAADEEIAPEVAIFDVITAELKRLEQSRIDELDSLDALNRECAERGIDPTARRRTTLRSYERAQWRQLHWARGQLELLQQARIGLDKAPEPAPVVAPPGSVAEIAVAPPSAAAESSDAAEIAELNAHFQARFESLISRSKAVPKAAHAGDRNDERSERRHARKAQRQRRKRSRR